MARDFARDNRATAGLWQEYSDHRDHLMRHLVEASRGGCRSVLVVGAGNCNDIELAELAISFEAITLLDPDQVALDAAVTRQDTAAAIERLYEPIETVARRRDGRTADLVTSNCVLSQLLIGLPRDDHARARELMRSHVSALAAVANRTVLVFSDCGLVETEGEIPSNGGIASIFSWIDLHGRFFDHLMPHNILRAIHSPEIASAFTSPELYGVWLWEQGNARLATLAIGFNRREPWGSDHRR
jgi:hypothetical protein